MDCKLQASAARTEAAVEKFEVQNLFDILLLVVESVVMAELAGVFPHNDVEVSDSKQF